MDKVNLRKITKTCLDKKALKEENITQNQTNFEQNKNDKNKLMGALLGLGVISAGIVVAAHRIKKGKVGTQKLPSSANLKIMPKTRLELEARIKSYINTIKKHDGSTDFVDPNKLDEILTKFVGKNNVVEETFKPNGRIPIGRKKIYIINEREKLVLECHSKENAEGYVTRLFDIIDPVNGNLQSRKKFPLRSYLMPDGSFTEYVHYNPKAHLDSGNFGLNWINQSI